MRITLSGSGGGGVDGGQYQMPMPHLITEGQITKGNQKIPMYLAQLVRTEMGLRSWQAGKGLELNLAGWEDTVRSAEIIKTPFTAAYTFAQVNQDSGFATG